MSILNNNLKFNSMYNMLSYNNLATTFFNPFIIFSFSVIKDTGIPIHVWSEDSMG